MIRLAYFLMTLSSAKMKSDLLTVRQFCRCGTGLYRAMVRARWALACFMEAVSPAEAASCPSPPRSTSPSPESTVVGAHSSPNRAILQRDKERTDLEWSLRLKTGKQIKGHPPSVQCMRFVRYNSSKSCRNRLTSYPQKKKNPRLFNLYQ